jgi:hypothetical protein
VADIAENADIGADILVDRGRVDVDVDLLRVGRERIKPPGDAVIKTRADADHDVAVMHRHVGFIGAVHAQHAHPVLARRGIGAQTHQRRGDRETGEFDQFAQQLAGFTAGIDDAAARIDDRALGPGHQVDGGADLLEIAGELGLIAFLFDHRRRRGVDAGGELDILGDVDHDRPGTSGGGDAEGFMDDAGELVDVLDQPVVLGAWPGDADGVAFLEGVEPISEVGTWPVRQTSGIESISASCRAVTTLVAPGPEVTRTTPGLPVERA